MTLWLGAIPMRTCDYAHTHSVTNLNFLILALIALVALVQSPLLLASLSLVVLLSFVVFKSSTGVGGLLLLLTLLMLLLLLLLFVPITLSLLTALVFSSTLLQAPLSMPAI
jgi:hypothetical protein